MRSPRSPEENEPLALAQQEIAALRAQVAARDDALARLTGRLLELERGQPGGESARLAAELDRLRASKTFRWSAAARSVYRQALTRRSP